MNSFITSFLGIIAFCVSLFYAFGTGVEAQRDSGQRVSSFLVCIFFAIASLSLLLVRS